MNKLPVGEAIRFGYTFTFGQIGTVIGLIWIPTLVNAIAGFFVLHASGDALFLASLGVMPSAPPPGLIYSLLYIPVWVLCTAMIGIAITRQALGLREGPAFAYLSLGGAELRAFAGLLALFVLFELFDLAVALAAPSLGAMDVAIAGGNANAAAALDQTWRFAAILLQVFLTIRLSFLLVASVAGESGFGLTKSWELTRRNFWRIVGVGLGTLLPIGILSIFAFSALLGPEYGSTAQAMMTDPDHMTKYATRLAQILADRTPQILGLGLVIAPITQGLLFAPAAFAYRALSGKPSVVVSRKGE